MIEMKESTNDSRSESLGERLILPTADALAEAALENQLEKSLSLTGVLQMYGSCGTMEAEPTGNIVLKSSAGMKSSGQ